MTRTVTIPALLLVLALPLAAPAEAPQAEPAGKVERFGAPLGEGEAIPVERVLARPEAWAGREVRVEGLVRRACAKKGCWMEIGGGTEGPGCRVTFRDYGFFVPKDAAGARATLVGEVQVKTLSKARADHLAAEGAQVERGADGTAREVQIVATGVELRR